MNDFLEFLESIMTYRNLPENPPDDFNKEHKRMYKWITYG